MLTASGSNLDNPPASYYKVLRRPRTRWKTPRSCSWPCASTATSATIIHSSLDAGSVLSPGRLLRPSRSQGRPVADRKLGGTAVEQRKPMVEVVYDRGPAKSRTSAPAKWRPRRSLTRIPGLKRLWRAPRRDQLARWITSKDNPYFAKSYVNRMWGYLFGVGIIEPIDDIRAGNPPSNPELLDRLTADFISGGSSPRTVPRNLQVAESIGNRSPRTVEQGRQRQLLACPGPPPAGRDLVRCRAYRDRLASPAARRARGLSASQLPDGGRRVGRAAF